MKNKDHKTDNVFSTFLNYSNYDVEQTVLESLSCIMLLESLSYMMLNKKERDIIFFTVFNPLYIKYRLNLDLRTLFFFLFFEFITALSLYQ